MTHFSDNLFLGDAAVPEIVGAHPTHGGRGVGPVGRSWDICFPPAAANGSNIATAFVTGSGTGIPIPLTGTLAQNGTAVLDIERSVQVTGVPAGGAVTVQGKDRYGQGLSQTLTNAGTAAATLESTKTFSQVLPYCTYTGGNGTVTLGAGTRFGFPYRVDSISQIDQANVGTGLGIDTSGTFVVADPTVPATATTGNVRGYYAPSAAATAQLNGTALLTVAAALRSALFQGGVNTTGSTLRDLALGPVQNLVGTYFA